MIRCKFAPKLWDILELEIADGPRFEVEGNVGWGLADNMLDGSIVVRGNASAIAGVAIRGAEVVVHGNIGSRAGQVMKAGTLCCAGCTWSNSATCSASW